MNTYKPMVYICSPYAGDIEGNTKQAIRYCRMAADHDCIPIAPHLYFPRFMSEETERDEALYNGLSIQKENVVNCDWKYPSSQY